MDRFPSVVSQPMSIRERPLTGGMGYAVFGGAEITGVFVLAESLLLQANDNNRLQSTMARTTLPRRKRRGSDLFIGSFTLFLGERFTGDSIFTFNPPAKVKKLTPLRTEGTKRIVFPLYRLTAGWAFHESCATYAARIYRAAGRLISIRRLTNAIVPSRRMAFKRTVTLSRVEPTIDAISR